MEPFLNRSRTGIISQQFILLGEVNLPFRHCTAVLLQMHGIGSIDVQYFNHCSFALFLLFLLLFFFLSGF